MRSGTTLSWTQGGKALKKATPDPRVCAPDAPSRVQPLIDLVKAVVRARCPAHRGRDQVLSPAAPHTDWPRATPEAPRCALRAELGAGGAPGQARRQVQGGATAELRHN